MHREPEFWERENFPPDIICALLYAHTAHQSEKFSGSQHD